MELKVVLTLLPELSLIGMGSLQDMPSLEDEIYPSSPTTTNFPSEYVTDFHLLVPVMKAVPQIVPFVDVEIYPSSPTTTNTPFPKAIELHVLSPPVERDVHVIPSTNLYTVPFLNAQKASCAKITPFNIPIPRLISSQETECQRKD